MSFKKYAPVFRIIYIHVVRYLSSVSIYHGSDIIPFNVLVEWSFPTAALCCWD